MRDLKQALVFIIVLQSYVSSKVLFVSEVCRHGPRTPSVTFNLTVEPYHDLGEKDKMQHYIIGSEVRRRYVDSEPLISSSYINSQVFFRSTNSKLAFESLESQLLGLYTQKECDTRMSSFQKENALPPFEFEGMQEIINELGEFPLPDCIVLPPIFSRSRNYDFKLGIHDSNCTGFKQLKNELINSTEYELLQKPYIDLLLSIFKSESFLQNICPDNSSKLCSLSNISDKRDIYNVVHDICKFLVFSNEYNLNLKFNFTSSDLTNCTKFLDNTMFYEVWGDERLWKVGAKRYLEY